MNLIQEPTSTEKPQPEVPESFIEDFSNNDEYKLCTKCDEFKLLSDFYIHKQTNKHFSICKECQIGSSRVAAKEYWENKRKNNGGSEKVRPRPNMYTDQYQKEQTFWVMELMGWTYNDNGVWSKEGIKDKNKVWDKIPEVPKVVKVKKGPRPSAVLDMDKVRELREQGLTFNKIGEIFKVSGTTIIKYFYKDEEN